MSATTIHKTVNDRTACGRLLDSVNIAAPQWPDLRSLPSGLYRGCQVCWGRKVNGIGRAKAVAHMETGRVIGRSERTRLKVVEVGPAPTGGVLYKVGGADAIQTDKTHFSISCPERDPTWEEIAAARYALLPKLKDCAMVLPPEDQYVNVHEHCFHVHLLRTLGPGGWAHNKQAW
jgi:hypothetical protein